MQVTDTENIVGVHFSRLDLRSTVDLLADRLEREIPFRFSCVNPHSAMLARRDIEFCSVLTTSDLNTPDGVGVVLASRILGGRIPERVCGPDIFPMLCATLNLTRPGTKMFFLGTTVQTLDALRERFSRDFPSLVVVGTMAPPFRQQFSAEDEETMVNAINASGAEVLWIGLGAPKQEKLAHRLRERLNVKLIGPVGGVFDFYTGRVKLPPRWMQRAGLIWLYRWCQQPRRLFRRNLDAPLFLLLVIWQRLTKGRVRGGR